MKELRLRDASASQVRAWALGPGDLASSPGSTCLSSETRYLKSCLDFLTCKVKPITTPPLPPVQMALRPQEPVYVHCKPPAGVRHPARACWRSRSIPECQRQPQTRVVSLGPTFYPHSVLSGASTCGTSLSKRPFLCVGLCFNSVKRLKGEGWEGRRPGDRGERDGAPTKRWAWGVGVARRVGCRAGRGD